MWGRNQLVRKLVCWPHSFYSGARMKNGIPPHLAMVPTPFPPLGGLELWRTPSQARLGPEVSAGPRPPGCPEA